MQYSMLHTEQITPAKWWDWKCLHHTLPTGYTQYIKGQGSRLAKLLPTDPSYLSGPGCQWSKCSQLVPVACWVWLPAFKQQSFYCPAGYSRQILRTRQGGMISYFYSRLLVPGFLCTGLCFLTSSWFLALDPVPDSCASSLAWQLLDPLCSSLPCQLFDLLWL